jgi:hypothetical protein
MPFAVSLKSRRRIERETNHLEKKGMLARNKDLHFALQEFILFLRNCTDR